MENQREEKEKHTGDSYQAEDFFKEIGEYLDEVARGELLTANEEKNGVIQMMFYTDDDEKLAEGKQAKPFDNSDRPQEE